MKPLIFLLFLFGASFCQAQVSEFTFDSELQEKRYRTLVAVLRCPTCQNQNLADSNSLVAEDLKQIVYEKVKAGESDEAILIFMKQRYGEFILYEPEVKAENFMLWAGPFLFLLIVSAGFFSWYWRNKKENLDD